MTALLLGPKHGCFSQGPGVQENAYGLKQPAQLIQHTVWNRRIPICLLGVLVWGQVRFMGLAFGGKELVFEEDPNLNLRKVHYHLIKDKGLTLVSNGSGAAELAAGGTSAGPACSSKASMQAQGQHAAANFYAPTLAVAGPCKSCVWWCCHRHAHTNAGKALCKELLSAALAPSCFRKTF
jgi:hypothetical protein